MAVTLPVTLSILFSLVVGTAACVLSVLMLEVLRRTPFGRAVFLLSVVMGLFIVYHVFALLWSGNATVVRAFKSVLLTGVGAIVWILILSQRRIRRESEGVDSR